MSSTSRARRAGRALRLQLDPDLSLSVHELIGALRAYLDVEWGIEVCASVPRRMKKRKACIKPGKLDYDRTLEGSPKRLLHVLCHEVGHALHHRRVHGLTHLVDPAQVMSAAAKERGLAEARYSPVTRDEAQAEAFAVEFVCPADHALREWLADRSATSTSVAARFHTTRGVARAQLGEALYEHVQGRTEGRSEREGTTPDIERVRPPNERQQEAITHSGSAALVDAGPGCGKTFTLVERVAWLLDDAVRQTGGGPAPLDDDQIQRLRQEASERVLALTFSTEAANELEDRLAVRLDPSEVQGIHVATFHGFGRQLLAEYGEGEGVDTRAPVLDEAAQVELMIAALATPGAEAIINLKDPEETALEAVRHVQHLKLSLTGSPYDSELHPWTPSLFRTRLDALEAGPVPDGPDDAEAHAKRLVEARAFLFAFEAYEAEKRATGALDFADLIAMSIRVLRQHPDVADYYRSRYRDILVDEFQDVSRAVSLFLELLCGPEGKPWVVGDPNQSIYRFLNADPENVSRYPRTFRGTSVFELDENYRAAPEIVGVANRLAALLKTDDEHAPSMSDRFVAVGTEIAAPALRTDSAPVVVAVATSDAAERAGVVETVAGWIERGVAPHEIAVLARRNVDVRETALALGLRGIRASVGAILTPDGTAGDLAAVVTFADDRAGFRSALPRVAYALGRRRYPVQTIDRAVTLLLEAVPTESAEMDTLFGKVEAPGPESELVRELERAYAVLRRERYAGDAFDMIAAFLFDGSDYARRLLTPTGVPGPGEPALSEAALTLQRAEASSTLARGAAYRHAHPRIEGEARPVTARKSRLDFAAAFRRALAAGIPTPVAPPHVDGAVQVMTCHASKGLEFPYVCVVGQTLSTFSSGYGWLPDELQPDPSQDNDQADALFFVAATRAKRSLVVSYAERPNVGKGRARAVTPLLGRWMGICAPLRVAWTEPNLAGSPPAPILPVWGRHGTPRLSPHHLDGRTCPVSSYLERFAGLRFPESTPPLYPLYLDALRQVVRGVLRAAHDGGVRVPADVVVRLFTRAWGRTAILHADHAHVDLYRRVGVRSALAFASAYATPLATVHRPAELDEIESGLHPEWAVSSGILAAFICDEGHPVAIVLRSESYAKKAAARGGRLLWSEIGSPNRQIPFALFHEHWTSRHATVAVQIFSAVDGALYPVDWSTRKTKGVTSMEALRGKVITQLELLAAGPFVPAADGWTCARCRSRVHCPHHLNAPM